MYLYYAARIDDQDTGYEQDSRFEKSKRSRNEVLLLADRLYYKNLDNDHAEQEKSDSLMCCCFTLFRLLILCISSFQRQCME